MRAGADVKTGETATEQRTVLHPNLVLGICCLSLLLVGMDGTIVNVALPAIARDLHASVSSLQWVVDAYGLVVASLLILAGSVADRFGRRRVFQTGLVVFTAGSLLCSVARGIEQLVAFRAVQGLGASMMNPVALSIIANTFPEARERARAIGVWGAVAGVSLALGPVLGGALTGSVGWRSVFWINLPVGLAALGLTAWFVPESRAGLNGAARARALDPGGQVLVFLALGMLASGVIEGPRLGWETGVIRGLFAGAAAAAAGFVLWERRRAEPLIELRFFRSVPFSAATVVAVCSFGAFGGFLFVNALYLQQVRGFSALATGLCTLPLALGMMVCGPLSGRMVGALGTRPSLLLAGTAIAASGGLLTGIGTGTEVGLLLGCYGLFGAGMGMVNPAITNTAVSGMPRAQAGVAAAIASTSRQTGAAMGVALAGTVVHGVSGAGFAAATHGVWWGMVGCGVVVAGLGWVGSTGWARASAGRISGLVEG